MIRLHSDYLVFELESGESIPCSVDTIANELVDAVAGLNDKSIIENAARAVVHYFREEKNQEIVSIKEFIDCLAFVLKGFGFEVELKNSGTLQKGNPGSQTPPSSHPQLPKWTSLTQFLETHCHHGALMELHFFQSLRTLLAENLKDSPEIVLFTELRPCVQSLLSARRWTKQCEKLRWQIVFYLEDCLNAEAHRIPLKMMIR
nr:hypothetical protein [Cytophagales bacterium]